MAGSKAFLTFNQTAFFIKSNPIADHSGIVVLKYLPIHPVINLRNCFLTGFLQPFLRPCIFDLKYCRTVSGIVLNDNVAAPLSMLPVRFYRISCSCKYPGKKCMVKIFPVIVITFRSQFFISSVTRPASSFHTAPKSATS